jgi:lipopolysaccharide transport system permease protein
MGAVGAGLVDLAIGFALFLVMMPCFGVWPSWSIVLVPLILLLLLLAAVGMGTLLSALTVAYRDFRHVVPFAVQLWMFATPCIYLEASSLAGPRGQAVLSVNPAYGLIHNFRQAMFGGPLDWTSLAVSATVSVVLLLVGCLYFRRVERSFADII